MSENIEYHSVDFRFLDQACAVAKHGRWVGSVAVPLLFMSHYLEAAECCLRESRMDLAQWNLTQAKRQAGAINDRDLRTQKRKEINEFIKQVKNYEMLRSKHQQVRKVNHE